MPDILAKAISGVISGVMLVERIERDLAVVAASDPGS
jgi:hypothetical protein